MKQMRPEWLLGTSMLGYGCTLTVGIGIPIPILSEEILQYTLVSDADIFAPVLEFSEDYPQGKSDILGEVSYAQLKSGKIEIQGKSVPSASLSSYPKAVEIAHTLKMWIQQGKFLLAEAAAPIPGVDSGVVSRALKERSLTE